MLNRDVRRMERRRAADRFARREGEKLNDKWTACPARGKSATQDEDGSWFGTKDISFFPRDRGMGLVGHSEFNVLYCWVCHTIWYTETNVTHP